MTVDELKDLVNNISPALEVEIARVQSLIDDKKIILIGEQDDHRHYQYIDNRNENQKVRLTAVNVFK